jgi:UDP-N-acetyl-2-amino-2-deoxyglucuronate dehydrogenase
MKPLRFGIIGLGNVAPVHVAAIHHPPGADLVAVATRNPDRGRAFVAQHGGDWYADYQELLARGDLDAVALCTPHNLHAPMTQDAAAAGKHVLCEKPMACTVAECDAMIAACESAGVTLGVIFQGRFDPLAHQLKAALDAGHLGRLLWASASTHWYRTDEYYRSALWRGTWAGEGGGVLLTQAIHAVDLLLWLTSTPCSVTARMRTLNHEIEVEDSAVAILEYAGGELGLIEASTNAFPGYPERLGFHGSQGSAVYHKGQGRLEWHLLAPREDRVDESGVSSGAARPMDITATLHAAQFLDFVTAVREGRHPAVDGWEGRRSVELIEAIYSSARSGTSVTLPLP